MAVALVTGAQGFLGRYICGEVLNRGDELIRLTRGNPRQEKSFLLSSKPTAVEICRIVNETNAETIYHLAGTSQVVDLEILYQANVIFAQSVLSGAAMAKSPPKVVLIGSAAEYGKLGSSDTIAREGDTCRPISAYGISKLAQTYHGLAAREAGLHVTIVRLFNPIGVGSPASTALGSFVRQIASMNQEGGVLRTGSLHSIRDFIDVQEAARIIAKLPTLSSVQGGIFNVCTAHGSKLEDMVSLLIQISGIPIEHHVEVGRRGTSDLDRVVGSNDRLRALGFDISMPDIRSVLEKMLTYERETARKF